MKILWGFIVGVWLPLLWIDAQPANIAFCIGATAGVVAQYLYSVVITKEPRP